MYGSTSEEAVQDVVVITRTLLLHIPSASALLDSGSTHTLIANTFVDRIGMSVEDLGYDWVVSTPPGADLTTGVSMKGVTMLIKQHN